MANALSLEQVLNCGIEPALATSLLPQINQSLTLAAIDGWQHLTRNILKPEFPFALHELLYAATFSNASEGPAWFPTDEQIQATNLAHVMKSLGISDYSEFHAWTVQHRDKFWDLMIQRLNLRFRQPYQPVLDLTDGAEFPRWLVGARLNITESCFQAADDIPAIVYQPEGRSIVKITCKELNALSNQIANGLVNAGFKVGDAIGIVMPMTIEAVAIYLGIIKAGCVVVSIAESFAAPEIETRLRISNAKAVFTQDLMIRGRKQLPLYQKVIEANSPQAIVLALSSTSELRSNDVSWEAFLSSNDCFDPIDLPPEAHTTILFSSGTTGDPKAIPWTHTTPIKCAVDAHLHQDIHPGDVLAWFTSLGWMMGAWLIYASLMNRATIALYDGLPNSREYGEFIQNTKVTMLGVVPSLVNAWKASECMHGLDWSAIKSFSSTGECSNSRDMLYLMSLAGYKPVIEYCGGTEIGGSYITGTMIQPAVPATFTTPALGLDLVLLDDAGQPTDNGEAFLIPPSIGLSTELLNRDHHQVYYAHTPKSDRCLRRHGDQLERLPNGYYRAQGRVDDTMNLSGIKVSAIALEQLLIQVDGTGEVAAIAVSPIDGGPSQLIIYVVPTLEKPKDIWLNEFQSVLKHQLNPLFKIHDVILVETLPRTASNKMMRRLLRNHYQQQSPFCS
jgi:acetyl-CoA synthetase